MQLMLNPEMKMGLSPLLHLDPLVAFRGVANFFSFEWHASRKNARPTYHGQLAKSSIDLSEQLTARAVCFTLYKQMEKKRVFGKVRPSGGT